jgi:hypothetical protein
MALALTLATATDMLPADPRRSHDAGDTSLLD